MNLADFVFGLITNPQEEVLENRVGMRPPPQGHRTATWGSVCLSSSQGLVLRIDSVWSQTLSQGRERLLPCHDLALSLRLPQPSGWGGATLSTASIILLNSLIILFLGLRSPSSSSAVIVSSPQSHPCLPPSRSCLLLLFILDFQALLNHFGCFKITMPSLRFLFLSFVLLELSTSNLPLHLGVLTRAHPSWKPPGMGIPRLPSCRAPP